jgi:hypothetical protein
LKELGRLMDLKLNCGHLIGLALLIAGASSLLAASVANAADLPRRGEPLSSCLISGRSPLLDLPVGEISREVDFRYGRAVATSNERAAIQSSRPAFTWAMEARLACGTAIGYLRGSVVDDDSISKCDCFHDRMVGYLQ